MDNSYTTASSKDEYQRRVKVLKEEREDAGNDWDRLKNAGNSREQLVAKLEAVRLYQSKITRERAYRETGWDSEWGPQNDGHLTWITKLKDLWVKLDEKSDEIEHQLVE